MDNYDSAIFEAYIEPLKTALVIDDDYPTLDEILSYSIGQDILPVHSAKKWRVDGAERVKMLTLLNSLRNHTPPLIVDMHDGSDEENDTELVKRFHQSDFLVLDWNLEPGEDTGTKALQIIEQLLSNNHFNIVVINSGKSPEEIFKEIIQKLSSLGHADWQDYNGNIESILNKIDGDADLIDAFESDTKMYIAGLAVPIELKPLDAAANIMESSNSSFSPVLEIISRNNLSSKEGGRLIARLMKNQRDHHKVKQFLNRFSLTWSEFSVPSLWIKSESVFIAFSEKSPSDPTTQLLPPLDVARAALVASKPRPDHLILAKLRNAIDDSGIALQGKALKMKHASALWYQSLLSSDLGNNHIIESVVDRHANSLMIEVMPEVVAFTSNLRELEKMSGVAPLTICMDRFNVDLNDADQKGLARDQHNVIVNSVPLSGTHLSTGHVMEVCGEIWVAISPACSFVPGQSNNRQASFVEINHPKQFTALLLKKLAVVGEGPVSKAIRGRAVKKELIFIERGEKIEIFEVKGKNSSDKYKTESLFVIQKTWRHSGIEASVQIVTQNPRGGDSTLIENCKVFGQLRTEYALSLARRVSMQSSEVGLDYD